MNNDAITRRLPVELTDREIQLYGQEQAAELVAIEKLEDKRAEINEAIKPKKKRVDKLAHIIDSKEEERQVDCLWRHDWEREEKRLIRTDTREIVETRKIDPSENQTDMFDGADEAMG